MQHVPPVGSVIPDLAPWLDLATLLLGEPVQIVRRLEGGDEALVHLLDTATGLVVLHLSPPWRSRAELAWVHQLVLDVHESLPEAVAPLGPPGQTVLEHAGRCAALYPYIDGHLLDRENPEHRHGAARTLAALHRATRTSELPSRPTSELGSPLPALPPELREDSLERWWRWVQGQNLTTAPIHGDYYRGNLICRGRQLVGVIDWHDARVAPLTLELAAATFELCKGRDQHLNLKRAQAFVDTYQAARGPIPQLELAFLPSLMRVWIREDAQRSLLHPDDPEERAYAKQQIDAFRTLRDLRFPFR